MRLQRYRRRAGYGALAAGAAHMVRRAGSALGRYAKRKVSYPAKSNKRRRYSRRSTSRSSNSNGAQWNEPDGMGGSTSATYYRNRGGKYLKGLKMLAAPATYMYTGAGRITSTLGTQNASMIVDLLDNADMESAARLVFPSSVDGYKTAKGLIGNCSVEVRITNQSKGNVVLTLYDIVPRRDINSALWNNTGFPTTAWTSGMTASNDSTSPDTVGLSNYGSTPFQSPLFTRFYKVVKVKKLIMAQGCVHVHKVHVNGSKSYSWMNGGLGTSLDDTYRMLKGFSKLTMAVISGFPLNDQTNKSDVAIGPVAVDWVSIVKINVKGYVGNVNHLYFDTTIPAITTPYVMDKGSGEPEAEVPA